MTVLFLAKLGYDKKRWLINTVEAIYRHHRLTICLSAGSRCPAPAFLLLLVCSELFPLSVPGPRWGCVLQKTLCDRKKIHIYIHTYIYTHTYMYLCAWPSAKMPVFEFVTPNEIFLAVPWKVTSPWQAFSMKFVPTKRTTSPAFPTAAAYPNCASFAHLFLVEQELKMTNDTL